MHIVSGVATGAIAVALAPQAPLTWSGYLLERLFVREDSHGVYFTAADLAWIRCKIHTRHIRILIWIYHTLAVDFTLCMQLLNLPLNFPIFLIKTLSIANLTPPAHRSSVSDMIYSQQRMERLLMRAHVDFRPYEYVYRFICRSRLYFCIRYILIWNWIFFFFQSEWKKKLNLSPSFFFCCRVIPWRKAAWGLYYVSLLKRMFLGHRWGQS